MMMQTAGFTIKGAGKALTGEKPLDINHRQFGYTCCQGHAIKEDVIHNPVAGFEWRPLNRFSMTAKVTQADVYAYIAKAKQMKPMPAPKRKKEKQKPNNRLTVFKRKKRVSTTSFSKIRRNIQSIKGQSQFISTRIRFIWNYRLN